MEPKGPLIMGSSDGAGQGLFSLLRKGRQHPRWRTIDWAPKRR